MMMMMMSGKVDLELNENDFDGCPSSLKVETDDTSDAES
jgi:hypothetical protein